jgi:hypothetical protein
MADAPDISKLVSIIMQNPALISQIAALANGAQDTESETSEDVNTVAPTVREEQTVEAVSTVESTKSHTKERRRELLNAMKPYLSESRRSALDSMASILDILDVMARKES